GVRRSEPPVTAPAWKVALEPAYPPKGRKVLSNVLLECEADDINQVLFSRRNVGEVVVLQTRFPNPLSLKAAVTADRYHLQTGKQVSSFDLCAITLQKDPTRRERKVRTLVAAVSPDASLVALCRPDDQEKRVDVWSLADGKHVAGWLPFESVT